MYVLLTVARFEPSYLQKFCQIKLLELSIQIKFSVLSLLNFPSQTLSKRIGTEPKLRKQTKNTHIIINPRDRDLRRHIFFFLRNFGSVPIRLH